MSLIEDDSKSISYSINDSDYDSKIVNDFENKTSLNEEQKTSVLPPGRFYRQTSINDLSGRGSIRSSILSNIEKSTNHKNFLSDTTSMKSIYQSNINISNEFTKRKKVSVG